jgi:hypothetical protein
MAKFSTGLRNALLDTGSLKAALALGAIYYYDGTPPLTADAAIGSAGANNLLTVITVGGVGINFDTTASSGTLSKAPGESWGGTNVATGTVSFFRHVGATEFGGTVGAASTTLPRIQGLVSTAGADLNLSSVSLVNGAAETLDYYSVALPTL